MLRLAELILFGRQPQLLLSSLFLEPCGSVESSVFTSRLRGRGPSASGNELAVSCVVLPSFATSPVHSRCSWRPERGKGYHSRMRDFCAAGGAASSGLAGCYWLEPAGAVEGCMPGDNLACNWSPTGDVLARSPPVWISRLFFSAVGCKSKRHLSLRKSSRSATTGVCVMGKMQ